MASSEQRMTESWHLSQQLIDSAALTRTIFAHSVVQFGLPVPVARAILMLADAAPMRDLAKQLGCDPSYITGLADQMEQRGLIERTTADDRRIKLLSLTSAGQALRKQITDAVAATALVQQKLDDAERQALATILDKLLN